MSALKPCPFCGSTALQHLSNAVIRCGFCGSDGPFLPDGDYIKAWNTRAEPVERKDNEEESTND
jgi:ribosomal protein L37AE/L43A